MIGFTLATGLAFLSQAQQPPGNPAPATTAEEAPAPAENLSPQELHELLAPIGLYPDALIAIILPASTFPSDVVLAERYLAGNGDPDNVSDQPWDDSIKSLVRYPDVLKWMDDNLEWTTSVGQAFVTQPADVMNAIQALRAEAKAKGNLKDTPQQRVVEEESTIRIVPADPEVIYVPQYDPEVVYVQEEPAWQPFITFGVGFAVGSWLNYDCDWNRHALYRGDWQPGWNYNRNWHDGGNQNIVNVVNINNTTATQWQPNANSRNQLARYHRGGNRHAVQNGTQGNIRETSRQPRNVARVPKPSRLNVTQADARKNQPAANTAVSRGVKANNNNAQQQPGKKERHHTPVTPAPAPDVATHQGGGKNSKHHPNQTAPDRTTEMPRNDTPQSDQPSKKHRVPTAPAPNVDQVPRSERHSTTSHPSAPPSAPAEAPRPRHVPQADVTEPRNPAPQSVPKAERHNNTAPSAPPKVRHEGGGGGGGGGQQTHQQNHVQHAPSQPQQPVAHPQGQGQNRSQGGGKNSDKKSDKKKNND